MDITSFVVSSREKAMLYGDYASYRSQLSGRLRNSRKKLGIATKNRGKHQPRPALTPEAVAADRENVYLAIMTAERAWAHAMGMKAAHSVDTKGISGTTRSHIISRLDKAAKAAENLASVLAQDASGAGLVDQLEARAYAALLRGAEQLEKQSWETCLVSYSIARVVLAALLSSSARKETYGDLLSETIDPSIRYAAYQLKTPRSLPIPAIARKAFPRSDAALVASVNELDSNALGGDGVDGDEDASKQAVAAADSSPTTLTFRSREVRIEDAAIATAWLALQGAARGLAEKLQAPSAAGLSAAETAAAYDGVLAASQDSADATKRAIDELKADGVAQSDPRMQGLVITRTAVNYEMISWRIGRNRVLTGDRDGAVFEPGSAAPARRKKAAAAGTATADGGRTRPDPPGRQLARLKEKVVLYDGNLQSLESVKELAGVAADVELSARLDATYQYFNALKCLALGRSHAIVGNLVNALALINHAHDQCRAALKVLGEHGHSSSSASMVRSIDVSPEDAEFLAGFLAGELQRHRALVEIENLCRDETGGGEKQHKWAPPLVDTLDRYPEDGTVDLDNIVAYPPRLEAVPVKPVFLDLAWNYIDYPDPVGGKKRGGEGGAAGPGKTAAAASKEAPQKPQKKGWFGFGR